MEMGTSVCAVCGLASVGEPQHILLMVGLAPWLSRGAVGVPDPKDFMRYRYRCANGHQWLVWGERPAVDG